MTMADIVSELKARFIDMNLPFQTTEYQDTINEALRKVNRHSGRTKVLIHSGGDAVVNLSSETKVRVVVEVTPSVKNVGNSISEFNVFGQNLIVGSYPASQNFYVRNTTDYLIRQTYSRQSQDYFGAGFDWLWDSDNKKLYINYGSISKYDGYFIKFLPDWRIYLDGSGEILDDDIIDDLLDLAEAMVREDIGRILKNGDAFGLPTGSGDDMLSNAQDTQDEVVKRLRSANPLLGMMRS